MERHPTPNRLGIGIGNPLRGDDGVGALLAAQVGGRSVRQLTPELAEELAGLEEVLFIDAWLAPAGAGPELRELCPAGSGGGGGAGSPAQSHHLEPATLLALSRLLYGRAPEARLLLVPAFACGHGTVFSAELRALLPRARALLRQWLSAGA